MDLDAFVATHRGDWDRLEELCRRRHLTGAEADEILDRYQRVATHLSLVRSTTPDPSLVAYLSMLLARARSRSAGSRAFAWSDVGRFFGQSFPAALYRLRWWWITVLVVDLLLAVVVGWWLLAHPTVESSLASPEQIRQLVQNDFESYYSEYAATSFALHVWTNNFWLSALCVASGVFGLISPHGMLELTCVFVAAGVGLRLFWSWVEPGPRTRVQALGSEGRSALATSLGLVVLLLLSGIIEAFVTPSPLPTWVRVGIGVVAEVAFFAYVFTAGRWAHRRGETGDLAEADRGYDAPVAG